MDYNDDNLYEDEQAQEQQSFYDPAAIEQRRRKREQDKRKGMIYRYGGLAAVLVVIVLIIVLISKGCSKGGSTAKPAVSGTPESPAATSSQMLVLPTPDPSDASVGASGEGDETAVTGNAITISAVGDIMCYDEQLTDAYDSVSGSYDFSHCFNQISSYTSASDITLGTLETTFSGSEAGYQGKPDFNTPEAMARDLASAGFDVLSTACTYSLQHGIAGLISTIKNIKEAGMESIGTYYTKEDRSASGGVLVKDINGVKVGFLSYTKGCNGISIPEGYEYSVNTLYTDYSTYFSELDKTQILADLTAAKTLKCDVLVAVLHWGSEYETVPSEAQNEVANLLTDNGVDIIIGSHPHYLQPVEQKTVTTTDGVEKQVLIAYSMGNFLSSMSKEYSNDSMILNITLSVDPDTRALTFQNVNYVPIYISGQGNRFTIYDINQSIVDFNSGSSSITDDMYATLKQSLDNIHKLAGSDLDIGTQVSYEPTPIIGGETTPEASPEALPEISPEASPAASPETSPAA